MRYTLNLCCLFVALNLTIAEARDPVRIDASSDKAANTTFDKMVRECPHDKQKALVAAMVQLNLSGAHTVFEILNDPNRRQMDAARIKDQIAGKDADEIIALAASTRKPDDPQVKAN